MSIRKNLFIALEGLDGSGKSTQATLLAERLRAEGHPVHATFQPSKGLIGTFIRDIFKQKHPINQHSIALLFAADRLAHLREQEHGLLAKKQQGFTIICDRYYLSSLAYQSVFVDVDWVASINQKALELLRPDAHVFVELSVATCLHRMHTNRENLDEYETTEVLQAVDGGYQSAFNRLQEDEHLIKVNGDDSAERVAENIYMQLAQLFPG